MTDPSIVALAGSCASRDNFNSRFNPDYKRWFSCDLAANQTSMITMMSPPVEPVFEPLGEMTEYDRWNVTSDLNREFLTKVIDLQPEYLILDFFADVHFGVLRMTDGRYVTDNRWKLWRTDFYTDRIDSGGFERIRWPMGRNAYFELWREALDRFAAHIKEHCPDTTVIVHRGWNASLTTVGDDPLPILLSKHKTLFPLNIKRGNAFWARLDDYAINTHGWESIDLRKEGYTSFAEHPWGPFYVHFTWDYYHRFLAELLAIKARRDGGADPDAVDHIRRAWAESAERQRITAQARLRQRDERIHELEGLGLVRSARFAVGQKIRRRRQSRSPRKNQQESR